MKLSAVMMVRNEATILAVNLAYHRSQGIDDFWIIDNGSTDGTRALLKAQQRSYGDVRWRSETGGFHQSEATSAAAAEAIAAGADWIVPIDADEFWTTARGTIRYNLADVQRIGAFSCQVDNFVQRRSEYTERADSLIRMTYRAKPLGTLLSAKDLVTRHKIGFVEMVYPPKLLLHGTPGLTIHRGNHGADNLSGPAKPSLEFRVLHAPIRARSALSQRAKHGVRVAEVSEDLDVGWHLRRWAQLDEDGTLEDDWNANSHRFSHLRVDGGLRRLRRDNRLRDAVTPFMRAR